jgi:hypothetical protein
MGAILIIALATLIGYAMGSWLVGAIIGISTVFAIWIFVVLVAAFAVTRR